MRILSLLLGLCLAVPLSAQIWPDDSQGIPNTDRSNFQAVTSTPAAGALLTIETTLEALANPPSPANEEERLAEAQARPAKINEFLRAYEVLLSEDALHQSVVEVREDEHWTFVWKRAQDLLEKYIQPDSDLHLAWRERYTNRAEVSFDNAKARLDFPGLYRVIEQFPIAPVAADAAALMAAYAFEADDLAGAADATLLALERNRYGRLELPTQALLIARGFYSARALGWVRHANSIELAAKKLSKSTIQVGDREITLEAWLAEVRKEIKDYDALRAPIAHRVALPLASLSGSPGSSQPKETSLLAWDRVALPKPSSELAYYGELNYLEPELSPIVASADDSIILVNSGEALSAYEYYTGRNLWDRSFTLKAPSDAYHYAEQDPNLLLTAYKYQDLAIAALENPLARSIALPNGKQTYARPIYSSFPLVRRALVAVDVTSGKERWRLGGFYRPEDAKDAGSELAKSVALMSFSTSTIVGDTIYAIGSMRENESRLYLVAIDPNRGVPLWTLLLGAGQGESNMFGNPMREALPGIPLYSEGVLYVVTNLGATVAVDLQARSVRWVARYEAMPRPYTRTKDAVYRKVTFANGAPSLARLGDGQEVLVVGPTDSRYLSCYLTETGSKLWQRPIEDAQRYPNGGAAGDGRSPTVFAGVHEEFALVGLTDSLIRIGLADGNQRDSLPVIVKIGTQRDTSRLNGRPVIGGDTLYWPGVYGISEIDLKARNFASQEAPLVSASPGNLTIAGGALICVSGRAYVGDVGSYAGFLEVRFDARAMLVRAEADAKNSPNDPRLKLRIIQLAKKAGAAGGYDDAAIERILREVIELSKGDDALLEISTSAARELFDRVISRATKAKSRRDGAAFLEAVKEAYDFVANESQERDLYLLEEEYAIDFGGPESALEFYARWLNSDKTFELSLRGVSYPVQVVSRWYYAEGLSALDRQAESLTQLDLLVAWSLRRAETPPLLALVRQRIDTITKTNPENYAGLSTMAMAAAQHAETLGDADAALELLMAAERWHLAPNLLAMLEASLAHAQKSDTTGLVILRIFASLRAQPVSPKAAELLVKLLTYHVETKEILRAWQVSVALRAYGDEARVPFKGKQLTIAEIMAELKLSNLLGDNTLVNRKMKVPLSSDTTWDKPFSSEINELVAPAARIMLVPEVIGEEKLGFASMTFVSAEQIGRTQLVAFKLEDGEEVWRAENYSADKGIVRVNNTFVIFESSQVVGLDADSGREEWRYSPGASIQTVNVAAGMAIVTLAMSRGRPIQLKAEAIDCTNGKELWSVLLGDYGSNAVAQHGPWFYSVGGDERGVTGIRKYDVVSGKLAETREINMLASRNNSISFGSQGELVFLSRSPISQGTTVYVLDGETLATVYEHAMRPNTAPSLEIYESTLLLVDSSGLVEARDLRSGKELWHDTSKPGFSRVDARLIAGDKLILNWQPDANTKVVWTTVYRISDGERLHHGAIWEPEKGQTINQLLYDVVPLNNGFVALMAITEQRVSIDSYGRKVTTTTTLPPKAVFFDSDSFKTYAAEGLSNSQAAAYYARRNIFVPTAKGLMVSNGLDRVAFYASK